MSDKWDKIFQDRFENWETPPPPGAWDGISAQLGPTPFPLYVWAGRVAAAVVIAMTVFVFPTGDKLEVTESLAGYILEENSIPSKQSLLADTEKEEIDSNKENTQKSSDTIELIDDIAYAPKQSINPKTGNSKEIPNANDIANSGSTTGKGNSLPPTFGSSDLADNSQKQAPNVIEAMNPSEEEVKGSELGLELLNSIVSELTIAGIEKPLVFLTKKEIATPELPDEKGERWNWGLTGNAFSTFVLVEPNKGDETIIASPEKSDFQTDRIGWSAGLAMSKNISKNVSISANASFQSLGVGNAYNHHSTTPDSYSFDANSGEIRTSSTVYETYASVRYNMVGTEFGLVYWWKRRQSNKGLGLSFGLNNVFQQNSKIGEKGWESEGLNSWVGSLSVSLPIQKDAGNGKGTFEWTPFVKYNIGNLPHPTGLFQWTPYSVGLRASILTKR